MRYFLPGFAAWVLLSGLLAQPIMWVLASPVIHSLSGLPHAGQDIFSSPALSFPGYRPVPVVSLLALTSWGALRLVRSRMRAAKPGGPWTEGMQSAVGLPFGEPAAQSAGVGFLPALPAIRWPRVPRFPKMPRLSAAIGVRLLLGMFALLLLYEAIG